MRQLPVHDGGASCTVDEQGAARRNVEFADIARRGLRHRDRTDDGDVRLTFDKDEQLEEAVRQVFARESECCAFFTFDIRDKGGELVVTATAPDDKADYLDALYHATDPDRTPDGTGTANDHAS